MPFKHAVSIAVLAVAACFAGAAGAAAPELPPAAAVREAGVPVTLMTVNKHKCQKNMDYLEFGQGAKDRMCDFVELAVQKAKMRVVFDPLAGEQGAGGLLVNVTMMTEVVEGFDGKLRVVLEHEDEPGVAEVELNDVSFCDGFLSKTHLYPTPPGERVGEVPAAGDGEVDTDGPPTLSALLDAGASLCVPYTPILGHIHAPLPHRPGTWRVNVYLIANSGSLLGRIRFKLPLSDDLVAWAAEAAATGTPRAAGKGEEL